MSLRDTLFTIDANDAVSSITEDSQLINDIVNANQGWFIDDTNEYTVEQTKLNLNVFLDNSIDAILADETLKRKVIETYELFFMNYKGEESGPGYYVNPDGETGFDNSKYIFQEDFDIRDLLIKRILYRIKYFSVDNFFHDNYEAFLSEHDRGILKNSERAELLVKAVMSEFDVIQQKIGEISLIYDIDKVPDNFLDYLAGQFGFKKNDYEINNLGYRTLIRNILDIYNVKGTNYSFDLFFKFFGFSVDIKEFYFDRRNFYKTGENIETSNNDLADFRFYSKTANPLYLNKNSLSATHELPELSKNTKYLVYEPDIDAPQDLIYFNFISGKYSSSIITILGWTHIDPSTGVSNPNKIWELTGHPYEKEEIKRIGWHLTDTVSKIGEDGTIHREIIDRKNNQTVQYYKYFKTNYISYSLKPFRKGLTKEDNDIIKKYIDFLVPAYILRNVDVRFEGNAEHAGGWNLKDNIERQFRSIKQYIGEFNSGMYKYIEFEGIKNLLVYDENGGVMVLGEETGTDTGNSQGYEYVFRTGSTLLPNGTTAIVDDEFSRRIFFIPSKMPSFKDLNHSFAISKRTTEVPGFLGYNLLGWYNFNTNIGPTENSTMRRNGDTLLRTDRTGLPDIIERKVSPQPIFWNKLEVINYGIEIPSEIGIPINLQPGSELSTFSSAKFGNGINPVSYTDHLLDTPLSTWSISFWHKFQTADSPGPNICSIAPTINDSGLIIANIPEYALYMFDASYGEASLAVANTSLTHIGITFKNSVLKLFINNTKVFQNSIAIPTMLLTGFILTDVFGPNSLIDNLKIYDDELPDFYHDFNVEGI
jgi:hypothetical protein